MLSSNSGILLYMNFSSTRLLPGEILRIHYNMERSVVCYPHVIDVRIRLQLSAANSLEMLRRANVWLSEALACAALIYRTTLDMGTTDIQASD
jgi:hypothetical protein